MAKELLLHTCCGPCATYSSQYFLEEGWSPALYFYNPNIHPYQEYKSRLEGFRRLAEIRNLTIWVEESGYELESFLTGVVPDLPNRCTFCYRTRLERTASKARELNIPFFSTTLLISPYQNREMICQIGHSIAVEKGLTFVDVDLRPGFRQSQSMAREMGLYLQKYCGCIFSEKERYQR